MSQVVSDTSGKLITPAIDQSRRLFMRRSAAMAAMGAAAVTLLRMPKLARADQADPTPDDRLRYKAQGAYFDSILMHENDHVDFLVGALGGNARPMPTFQNLQQSNILNFVNVSQALENTGVGAYLGAIPSIKSSAYLAASGTIAFIEARHAGFLNTLVEDPITCNVLNLDVDRSFEKPLTPDQVVAGASMFIADLNGGPPIDYSTTASTSNDVAILNFALALEYLEAAFYNVNVPIFFPG